LTRIDEIAAKKLRVLELLDKQGLDGLLLTKRPNFAWFTGGGNNHVSTAAEVGAASLLITKNNVQLFADNIETPRIMAEEVAGLGVEPVTVPWYEGGKDAALRAKVGGLKLGSDIAFGEAKVIDGEVAKLRWSLLPVEVERYRRLGRECAAAMEQTLPAIRPGQSEFEVAAVISGKLIAAGILPQVVLIAADERIGQFRHPIPTAKKIDKYCMVVICGQRQGLIVSMTRLVAFDKLSEDLARRHQAVAEVDAALIAATHPGKTAGEMFTVLQQAYAANGFPEEWMLHHQGGATGYVGRDWKPARADDLTVILENQAFAWNPSITGTKSEDTIIATDNGPEIISSTPGLPAISIQTEIGEIKRADILII
jgi:Xaa-Pro aminopeptidase